MEEREPIQVSFRLPAGTLEGLSRLVEQLRLLAAEVGGGADGPAAAPVEYGRNDEFDRQRYEVLRQEPEVEAAQAVRAELSDQEAAQTVPGEAVRHMEDPMRAADAVGMTAVEAQDAADAKADASPEEVRERSEAEAARQEFQEDPPAVRAAADRPVEEPAAVRMEPESQIPAAEAVWTEINGEELAAQAVKTAPFSEGAEVRSAGFIPVSAAEESSIKWNNVARELTEETTAPLTAEAVSLAFRRDGRRYDNGFPLY